MTLITETFITYITQERQFRTLKENMCLQIMITITDFTVKCMLSAMSTRLFTHITLVKRQKTNTLTLPL